MDKIGVGYAYVSEIEKRYVNEALDDSRLSQGRFVHEFEKRFAFLHDERYGIACNSGTSALHVCLEAIKEKHGLGCAGGDRWLFKKDKGVSGHQQEVLVPAITFIATSNAVLHAGWRPVFVDVDSRTYNMNPEKIEEKITERTVGIMPVHTFGQPCEMDAIMEIAQRHNLWVLEDVAEAHFATYKGKKVGSFGEMSGYSTYVAHTITTGIGGVITTNDRELMEISRSLIAHGRACTCEVCLASDPAKVCPLRIQTQMDKRFMMLRLGYSYRVGELEGAIGLGQLENRELIMGRRKKNAHYLTERLQGAQQYLQLPWAPDYVDHSYMMYPIVVKQDARFAREALTHFLESANVETRPMLPLLSQPIYKQIFGELESEYPMAAWIDHNGFYVGCHHGLGREQLDKIADTILAFLSKQ